MKHFTKHLLVLALALGGSFGTAWAADGDVTVTIGYKDIPDGYTNTGTSGNFTKTVSNTNDLTINYSGINTKSSATAADHAYGYAMFLKNYGYIYNSVAPAGYYPSKVTVTFGSNTGTTGKAGITFGSSVLNTRNSSVSGTVSKSGTCTLTNEDKSKLYWNFSTTGANVQVNNIEVVYSIAVAEGTVATPTFSASTGTYNEAQSITLTCATEGATIYYTTDGSTPTTSSNVYSEAITVNTTGTTIKAFATKADMTSSEVASATYTLVPSMPEITNSGSTVTITSTGATSIYYTTDGTTPSNENGTLYTASFDLEASPKTVKAIAYGFGSSSDVANKTVTFVSGIVIWSEDFTDYAKDAVPTSGTNATYVMTDGGSPTKIWEEKLAGGTSPELLIGKTNGGKSGIMAATINLQRYYGNMTLVFKSNNPSYLEITSTTTGVTIGTETNDNINKLKTVPITVPEGTSELVLKITNNNGSNARVDDFELYATSRSNPSVSITSAKYATFCSDVALDFTGTGLTAYVASVSDKAVSFEAVTKVPANTGILLKGNEGTYNIPVAESASAVESALVGVAAATEQEAGIFVLMNGASGVGFYKTTNAFTVGANTAYLPASAASAKVRFIGLDGEEIADGIEAIEATESVDNGVIYNLAGQRVAAPTKGIYIKNGKKFIIK